MFFFQSWHIRLILRERQRLMWMEELETECQNANPPGKLQGCVRSLQDDDGSRGRGHHEAGAYQIHNERTTTHMKVSQKIPMYMTPTRFISLRGRRRLKSGIKTRSAPASNPRFAADTVPTLSPPSGGFKGMLTTHLIHTSHQTTLPKQSGKVKKSTSVIRHYYSHIKNYFHARIYTQGIMRELSRSRRYENKDKLPKIFFFLPFSFHIFVKYACP